LVAVRAKRSGQRWHDEGVSAALKLQAIHQSERLPGFWHHLHRRYVARVEAVKEEALSSEELPDPIIVQEAMLVDLQSSNGLD
jgi:hypothetical protein